MSIVRHLLIQSVDRISGTTNNFTVKIPLLMSVGQVSLLSASIPNTIYNSTAFNNTIYWTQRGALLATLSAGVRD
jgi:hypothetical protein